MICGHCRDFRTRFSNVMFLHWETFGCTWGRSVWERVFESKRLGHSGRRLLHEAWPDLYPSEPMSEEDKAKLRELAERRKAEGVKIVKVKGRRWAKVPGGSARRRWSSSTI